MQVCHELMAKAWDAVRAFVHSGHGAPSPKHMLRLLRHTCEHQVSTSTLPSMNISVCARTERCAVMLDVLSRQSVDCLRDTNEQYLFVLIEPSALPLQVAQSMAQEWAIFKVGTSDMVPGPADAWAYVLKGRVSTDEQPSEFEQLAMQRSCLLVVEVRLHSPSNIHPSSEPWAGAELCAKLIRVLTACKRKCLQYDAPDL